MMCHDTDGMVIQVIHSRAVNTSDEERAEP